MRYCSDWIDRNYLYVQVPSEDDPTVPHYRQVHRPVIVCLCGSTRFPDAWIAANRSESMAGRIVLSVGLFGHQEAMDMDGPVKKALDELHKRKIDLADEILVLNCRRAWCLNHARWTDKSPPDMEYCCANVEHRPYVGESTRSEIVHARRGGKTVRWLDPDAVPEDLK